MRTHIEEELLQSNYSKYKSFGRVYFPLKTNSNKEVLSKLVAISSGDMGFLASTEKHIDSVISLDLSKVTYINTLTDVNTLIKMYNTGVRSFVFDSLDKYIIFEKAVQKSNLLEITIKLSIGDIAEIPVNTGASFEEAYALSRHLECSKVNYGYSIYINAVARKKRYTDRLIEYILKVSNTDKSKFISIGGLENNRELSKYLKLVQDNTCKEVRLEPGEGLVKHAITTEFNVININRSGNSIALTIDGSVYNEFFDFVALSRSLAIKSVGESAVIPNELPGFQVIDIFGNSGDSNDYLGRCYLHPSVGISKYTTVELYDTGYYLGRQ